MSETKVAGETSPTIVEAYRDYSPPPTFKALVQDLLKAVPPRYLVGLKAIILTNQAAGTRHQKRQKVWEQKSKNQARRCAGILFRRYPLVTSNSCSTR
jgi:hypothetical protein